MEGSALPRSRYLTQTDVALHNEENDVWVSYLGHVYDLTSLCAEHKGSTLIRPILEAAGSDISHWFNKTTLDIRTRIDEETGCLQYSTPMGRFLHTPPPFPCSNWKTNFGTPWWQNDKCRVGVVTKHSRHLRIINTLTSQESALEACEEETLSEILERYLYINRHAKCYTWKYNGVPLDMGRTLQENGIANQDDDFYNLGMDEEEWRPAIMLYYNDDLTEM